MLIYSHIYNAVKLGADNKNGLGGLISNVSKGLLPSGGDGGRRGEEGWGKSLT